MRVVAYCRLMKRARRGSSPFGILMFADSYDCLLIPNSDAHQVEFQCSLDAVREYLRIYQTGEFFPATPQDNRCSGCHLGKPRRREPGSETILERSAIEGICLSWKRWCDVSQHLRGSIENVPPHSDAERLQYHERVVIGALARPQSISMFGLRAPCSVDEPLNDWVKRFEGREFGTDSEIGPRRKTGRPTTVGGLGIAALGSITPACASSPDRYRREVTGVGSRSARRGDGGPRVHRRRPQRIRDALPCHRVHRKGSCCVRSWNSTTLTEN